MSKVSDSYQLKGKTIKNRMTFAPTVKFDYAGADGKVTDKHIEHYKERAEGGIGLICVEATAVLPGGRFGENHLGLWNDDQVEGHKAIVKACHDNDVVCLIQLNHVGIGANPICGEPIGPSAVETRSGAIAHAMSIEEIREMEDAFTAAAVRAKAAGYDGIQLHGCHSYLINQFVCPKTNLRTDEYGGSAENRARFGSEIIRKIREACGDDFIISIRTVGADPSLADEILVAEEYVKAGCDFLQVSMGIELPEEAIMKEENSYGFLCSLGVHFHDHFKGRVPVSCVGGILDPEKVNYLIDHDLVDFVDLARAELADPAFPNAVLNGTPYVHCFECKRCQYGPGGQHRCPAAIKRSKQREA